MLEAARLFGESDFLDGDLDLPLYNGDVEAEVGLPPKVATLVDQLRKADAVVLVSPEYNQSLSGVMKNALDWMSRAEGAPWRNKPVAMMSATAGRAGGARAQYALRLCMLPFRANVMAGPEVLVAGAQGQFDEAGRIAESYAAPLAELMGDLRIAATG